MHRLLCLVGRHSWQQTRAVAGVKIVEHCTRCPRERVRYVATGIDFSRKLL